MMKDLSRENNNTREVTIIVLHCECTFCVVLYNCMSVCNMCLCVVCVDRVEIRLGHPGHILPGSSRSHSL